MFDQILYCSDVLKYGETLLQYIQIWLNKNDKIVKYVMTFKAH